MTNTLTILGIAGSLRKGSYNRAALRAAVALTPEGATIETFELDGIPGFNEDQEKNPPQKIVELKQRIRAADAILFVTPEYNYSIPGVLKNAIDIASRPYGKSAWANKPGAVISVSPGAIESVAARSGGCSSTPSAMPGVFSSTGAPPPAGNSSGGLWPALA